MSAFYATNKEVKILSDKLDLLNTKLDSVSKQLIVKNTDGSEVEIQAIQRPDGKWVINQPGYEIATDSNKVKVINSVDVNPPDAYQEVEEVFEQAFRKESTNTVRIQPPVGARGFLAELNIGATVDGTFADGDGAGINVYSGPGIHTAQSLGIKTDKYKQTYRRILLLWYPGAKREDALLNLDARHLYVVGLPISKTIDFQIEITGEFEPENLGISTRLNVEWLV